MSESMLLLTAEELNGVQRRGAGAGRAVQAAAPDRRSAGGRAHGRRCTTRRSRRRSAGVAPSRCEGLFSKYVLHICRSDWRDVYLAAGARGLSTCGDFLAATALALALQSAGRRRARGVRAAAGRDACRWSLLAPLTGRLADRVDSRTLLVGRGSGAGRGLRRAGVRRPHRSLIIGLVALLACGLAVTQPTLAALLPEMVRRGRPAPGQRPSARPPASIGMLIGPALAGLLVGQFGVTAAAAARRGQLPGPRRGGTAPAHPPRRRVPRPAGGGRRRRSRGGCAAIRCCSRWSLAVAARGRRRRRRST